MLVYESAWLKSYKPAAFICSLCNCQTMGFYVPEQLMQDARKHGVVVLPVDVVVCGWEGELGIMNQPPRVSYVHLCR